MSLDSLLKNAQEEVYRPSLEKVLGISEENSKQGLSEERLLASLDPLRDQIAYWREYPDQFIDFMAGPKSKFKLYTYQRIFLRCCMRYRNVCAVYPRGASKSFLSMLVLMVRCILFPGAHLSVTTGGKQY